MYDTYGESRVQISAQKIVDNFDAWPPDLTGFASLLKICEMLEGNAWARFDDPEPIKLNCKTMRVVDGHHRLKAAQVRMFAVGVEDTPECQAILVDAEGNTLSREDAYLILDNLESRTT